MLCDDRRDALFSTVRDMLSACGIPRRQADVFERVIARSERTATRCEVFLPADLPFAVAAAAGIGEDVATRAAAVATVIWSGADLMDDAADGDLRLDDWGASSHQLALVYTNLLATLPHLMVEDAPSQGFSRCLAESLWLMSHGQFSDLESATAVQRGEDYLDVIALKTGAEAAFFAQLPLLMAAAPEPTRRPWETFGLHIGCMLQLFSDIYGTLIDEPGNDLLRGKRTLPVTHALTMLDGPDRDAFVAALVRVGSGDREPLPWLIERMQECGSAQAALVQLERFRFRAAATLPVALDEFPRSHPLWRLLKSCWLLGALESEASWPAARTEEAPASGTPPAAPRPPPRAGGANHAQLVASYYDAHTEPFYLRLWDEEDIHFGRFDDHASTLGPALKSMTEAIVAPAGIRSGEMVVDAGCGVGGAALDVARAYGARVLGMTISPRQVALARERAARAGLADQARFVVADCSRELPLDDGSVDVLISIEAACHLPDKERFVRECWRVLRPGGRLVGSDWMRTARATTSTAQRALTAVEQAWHLGGLLSGSRWFDLLSGAGFARVEFEDFGDSVLPNARLLAQARLDLMLERAAGKDGGPDGELWVMQCTTLANAWLAGWFTVGRFRALK